MRPRPVRAGRYCQKRTRTPQFVPNVQQSAWTWGQPLSHPVTYNVTYLMLDAIYQVQTFAMLFSSGDLNECEVGFSVLPGRDMTPWPGFGRAGSIRSYPVR